jgi:hypothetical protein
MAATKDLEVQLNDLFANKAPALPDNAKKTIVEYLPWINLAAGVFTLWAVYVLWRWAHQVDSLVSYVNSWSRMYGGAPIANVNHVSPMVWIGLLILGVEAVLYIATFPATNTHQKKGWDLLYYALLVNVIYGVAIMFTGYGGFGNFVSSLIESIVGLYFLFQIRNEYLGSKGKTTSVRTDKPSTTAMNLEKK